MYTLRVRMVVYQILTSVRNWRLLTLNTSTGPQVHGKCACLCQPSYIFESDVGSPSVDQRLSMGGGVTLPLPASGHNLAKSGDSQSYHSWGHCTGILWVEARDTAEQPPNTGQHPQEQMI